MKILLINKALIFLIIKNLNNKIIKNIYELK